METVASQTLTNGDYTTQQLNVIIDCIEFYSSPLIVLRLLLLFTGVFDNSRILQRIPESSRILKILVFPTTYTKIYHIDFKLRLTFLVNT